jgi:hypothetical protein
MMASLQPICPIWSRIGAQQRPAATAFATIDCCTIDHVTVITHAGQRRWRAAGARPTPRTSCLDTGSARAAMAKAPIMTAHLMTVQVARAPAAGPPHTAAPVHHTWH